MSGQEGLGRLFNLVPTADAVEINLANCAGVTFICVGADNYTLEECTDAAGGGAADLLAWDRWYTNSGALGATTWVLATDDTPPYTALKAVAANAAIYVPATRLSDGFTYVRCSSAAGGLVIAIAHDLHVQRDPANLPALGV